MAYILIDIYRNRILAYHNNYIELFYWHSHLINYYLISTVTTNALPFSTTTNTNINEYIILLHMYMTRHQQTRQIENGHLNQDNIALKILM